MKISNNKSLNDLFREAADHTAAESNENVPTQSDVERLLRNPNMRSVPVTRTLTEKLYERLLSSPLKIGMTAMTTAAILTLGIFAFWPQNNPSGITHSSVPSNNQSQRTYSTDVPLVQNTYLTASPNLVKHSTPILRAPVPETVPVTPITTADSLHPIDISPDQLAKLGIVLEDNGDIDFYTRDGGYFSDTNFFNHFSLLPSGGVRMHFRTHQGPMTLSELQQQNIIPLTPKLITAVNGEKRMFFFEQSGPNFHMHGSYSEIKNYPNANGKTDVEPMFDDDSTIQASIDQAFKHTQNNSNQPSNVRLQKEEIIVASDDSESSNPSHVDHMNKGDNFAGVLNIFPNGAATSTVNIETNKSLPPGQTIDRIGSITNSNPGGSIDIQVSPGTRQKIVINHDTLLQSNIEAFISHIATQSSTDTGTSHSAVQIEVKANNDEVSDAQYSSGTTKLANSNASSNGTITDVHVDPGTSVNVKTRSGNTVHLYGRQMDVSLDSGESAKIGSRRKIIVNADSLGQSGIREFISHIAARSSSDKYLDSFSSYRIKATIDSLACLNSQFHIPDIDSIYNSFVNDSSIGHLIPIRVVNNKNPEHPNELIFWYDATPEVEAALPGQQQTASISEVAPKSMSLSVYPNPTTGPVTVHYQLMSAPKAHFVVHNLLGQVVMDGGWSPDASGEEALDLSQLPAGVYLLVTTTENGDRDVERVVVAK